MTVNSAVAHSRGLGSEAFRRGDPGGARSTAAGRAAGLSSNTLQGRQESSRYGNNSYGSNSLLRGGEHPTTSTDRDHDRDQAIVAPRPDNLRRHRTDPTHDSGRQFTFPALPSEKLSRDGVDERGVGSHNDVSLANRRRHGAGTPPAYPPLPSHPLRPSPPLLVPNYFSSHGGNGSGGSASHSSAGSRSVPPGRNNRPTTPSSQVGGSHASRRVTDESSGASRLGPSAGAGPLGSAFEGREAMCARPAPEAALRSRSVAAPGAANAGVGGSSSSTCDKCDGKHPTDQCPHFRGDREKHKDAWVNYGQRKSTAIGGTGGNFVLKSARVIRQPGDGSCLFHSMAHGLPSPASASGLRREIAGFVGQNPSLQIAGDTLEEWVRWDSSSSVTEYARRMSVSGWGGGIEMAACSLLKNVNVHVYESSRGSSRSGNSEFKRISCFDSPNATRTIHVLYQGGVHYDALVPLPA